MNRINVFEVSEISGTRALVGHFDYDKAEKFLEDTDWDGENRVSVPTGSRSEHQLLLRTIGGRWVLNEYSNYAGTRETYRFITDERAREWLLINKEDKAVETYFGEIEEERGPGRPETVGGKPTNIKFGDDLTGQIKQRAQDGEAFAATVRRLLTVAVQATPPTSTIL